MNSDSYIPQFSTKLGGQLIENCLLAVEKETPDLKTLLLTLLELAKLLKTVDYDHNLLKNVITENKLLSHERDTLKLAQISELVQDMEIKLDKAERDYQTLQVELDVTELDVHKLDVTELDVPQFSFSELETNFTLIQQAS